MVTCQFDHLVLAASKLEDGIAHVEQALGVTLPFGGKHPLMGTHNALMQLGGTCFLEIIAVDPRAPAPSRPRWFSLDDPGVKEAIAERPRLLTWVCRTDNLEAIVRTSPADPGPVEEGRRGDLVWHITIPNDGSIPMGGAFPTLIQWPESLGENGPAPRMADLGCRLESLTITHPDDAALRGGLEAIGVQAPVTVARGRSPALTARMATPGGTRIIA